MFSHSTRSRTLIDGLNQTRLWVRSSSLFREAESDPNRSRIEDFVGNVYSLVIPDFKEKCTLVISFTDDPHEIKLTFAEFGRRSFGEALRKTTWNLTVDDGRQSAALVYKRC